MAKDDLLFKAALAGGVLLLAAIVAIGLMFFGGPLFTARVSAAPQQPAPGSPIRILSAKPEGELQRLTISAQGLTYKPYPARLKVGVPVELTLDLNIRSCLASFYFPAGGLRLQGMPGRNVAYFVPETAGEFPFTCSMNMGRGLFVFYA